MKDEHLKLPYDGGILAGVSKPGRYLGGEKGAAGAPDNPDLSVALAFPEVYELGMSHLGMAILYSILRDDPRVAVERVFSPWPDMEAALLRSETPLRSLESGRPLREFDVFGVSLLYELTYTNFLNMLRLSGIPLSAGERSKKDPLVIAGGPSCFNPEPLADFLDAVVLGDGEGFLRAMPRVMIEAKKRGASREEAIAALAGLDGVYIPSRYEPAYGPGGAFAGMKVQKGAPERVKRAFAPDLGEWPLPGRPIIPWVSPIHDRLSVEVSRGCTRGCRFCQAGIVYRPVRERDPEEATAYAERALAASGYEDVSLLSLSAGDYTPVNWLVERLINTLGPGGVAVSLPSLRVGTLSPQMVESIASVRKTGFTLAPEAGSERLRRVINKDVSDDSLMEEARRAFEAGWRLIKLYFMIGLPTETFEDIKDIVDLCRRVKGVAKGFGANINVAVSTFVPKPHTPFQWHGQLSPGEVAERLGYLRRELRDKKIRVKYHNPGQSFLEAVLSRGDRRLAFAVKNALDLGCRFDGWTEMFKKDLWDRAFELAGVDPFHYALNEIPLDSELPWDHLDTGVEKSFLLDEREKALGEEPTPDCREGCLDCGVCDFETVEPRLYEEPESGPPPAPLKEEAQEAAPHLLVFSRTGRVRFLSHLETMSSLLRAFRRAGWPLALTRGFNPKPRVSFSDALPVGVESLEERAVVWLSGEVDVSDALESLSRELPEGLAARSLSPVEGKGAAKFNVVHYRVALPGGVRAKDAALSLAAHKESPESKLRAASPGDDGTVTLEMFGQARPGRVLREALGLPEDAVKSMKITVVKRE